MLSVEMLQANEGDALWVEYGNPQAPHRMLIDCGYKSTYRHILDRLDADPAIAFELFILTHIDADHIAGAVPFIADSRVTPDRVREVWFNSREQILDTLGVEQAEYFTHFLTRRGFQWNTQFQRRAVVADDGPGAPQIDIPGGMRLTVLSPRRAELRALADHWTEELETVLRAKGVDTVDELLQTTPSRLQPDVLGELNVRGLASLPFSPDDTAPNGSSIAVLAEYRDTFDNGKEKAVLFAGDAFAPVLVESLTALLRRRGIERLPLSALKVSHHGSAGNTNRELLDLVDCRNFLISTNGTKHDHPDPECVARIVTSRSGTRLFFNYDTTFNGMWKSKRMQQAYRYEACYPADSQQGLRVDL
jgi:beta-lactamase superfamily II metal-dependent hydrolase